LNNFKKLEPISIIFAHSISRIFAMNHRYILTEPPVNLLYLAISDSGVNDVSLLRLLYAMFVNMKFLKEYRIFIKKNLQRSALIVVRKAAT